MDPSFQSFYVRWGAKTILFSLITTMRDSNKRILTLDLMILWLTHNAPAVAVLLSRSLDAFVAEAAVEGAWD